MASRKRITNDAELLKLCPNNLCELLKTRGPSTEIWPRQLTPFFVSRGYALVDWEYVLEQLRRSKEGPPCYHPNGDNKTPYYLAGELIQWVESRNQKMPGITFSIPVPPGFNPSDINREFDIVLQHRADKQAVDPHSLYGLVAERLRGSGFSA